PGVGTPTGLVFFQDGNTFLGTGTLNATGQATLSTSSLAIGTHAIKVLYAGDTNFASSSSAVLTQIVNPAASLTTISAATTPSVFGQSVAFTATVTAAVPGMGTPTGTVTFVDGSTPLGSAVLDGSGTASFATSSLGVGAHAITGVYSGDTHFASSTSAVLAQ